MPRIVISSQGTYGDFRPFLLLGRRLARRGHQVRMAVNPAMTAETRRAGLDAVPCGTFLDEARGRQDAFRFDARHRPAAGHDDDTWQLLNLEGNYHSLLAACADADLLIAASLQQAAPLVQEVLGLPWAVVSLLPGQFPLADADSPRFRLPGPSRSAPGASPGVALAARLLELRGKLGLRRLGAHQLAPLAWSAPLILLAASRHYCTLGPAAAGRVHVTGFWFEDGPGPEVATPWQPPPELAAFLAAGPEPLALTFSSLPLEEPAAVLTPVVEAAAALGRRLVVQRGWADFTPDRLPPGVPTGHVAWIEYAPHHWLFRQVAAVIHHGGVGTTAEALRAGRPVLVVPFGNDQPFNADRVLRLKVGEALAPAEVRAESVTAALGRLLTEETRRTAAALAAQVQAEPGLDGACDLVERLLDHPQLGRRSPIPKVIHQAGPDSTLPAAWAAFQGSWLRHHPHWEYRYWTESDVCRLIAERDAWFLPDYAASPSPNARLAVARYLLLFRHGGVYADLDCECLAPLDLVVAGRDLVLGREPPEHERAAGAGRGWDRLVGAGVLASRPGHPFWEHVFRQLLRVESAPADATGSVLLSRALASYPRRDAVPVEPPHRFYPLSAEQSRRGLRPDPTAYPPHDGPVVVRHWQQQNTESGSTEP